MGSRSTIESLKCVQWMFRAILFVCSVAILTTSSYFHAELTSHKLVVPTIVDATVGISAIGTFYTAAGLLFLCCCSGCLVFSVVFVILDMAIAASFIYIAYRNRSGGSSCKVRLQVGDNQPRCCLYSLDHSIFFAASILLELRINSRSRRRPSRLLREINRPYMSQPEMRRQAGGSSTSLRRAAPLWDLEHVVPDTPLTHQQPDQVYSPKAETWDEDTSLYGSDRLSYYDDSERLFFPDRDEQHEPAPAPVYFSASTPPRPATRDSSSGSVIYDGVFALYEGQQRDQTDQADGYSISYGAEMDESPARKARTARSARSERVTDSLFSSLW